MKLKVYFRLARLFSADLRTGNGTNLRTRIADENVAHADISDAMTRFSVSNQLSVSWPDCSYKRVGRVKSMVLLTVHGLIDMATGACCKICLTSFLIA